MDGVIGVRGIGVRVTDKDSGIGLDIGGDIGILLCMSYEELQRSMAEAMPDQVRLLGTADTGDRVKVTIEGVTAFGTIGSMGYHWSGIKGINVYPIVLDGTGQTVEVHAKYLSLEEGA